MRNKIFIGITVSLVLLWLAVRHVDIGEFTRALSSAHLGYVSLAFLVTIVVCLFRAMRWRLLFLPTKTIGLHSLLSVIMVGFLANNLLPARLGEVAMAYLMNKKEAVGKSRSMGTIFLDRLLDVFTLVGFLLVSFLLYPYPFWVKRIALVGILLLVLFAILIWLALSRKDLCTRVLRFCLRLLPARLSERILQIFVMFVDGLSALQRPAVVIQAVFISVLVWAALAGGVYLLFVAFNFPLGFNAAVTVLVIVNLGLIVPSSPGFVGTFQFFCVAALGLFAIDKSHALSFSVAYHLSQWLPTTLWGLYYLNRENLKLSDLATVKSA